MSSFDGRYDDKVWQEVKGKLMSEPFNMKQEQGNLRRGVCPSCSKKELWAKYAERPGVIYCSRESKCGYTATAKELFEELFDPKRIVRENPATQHNPNAPADAYMQQVRGFDLSMIKGWYQYQRYSYCPREAREENLPAETIETLRFELPAPMVGSWDRFLDGHHFGKKTTQIYGTKLNDWLWTPPDQELERGDQLFIAEGIFDAIALLHAGKKVAALMGASNKPQAFIDEHRGLRLKYVISLDNDVAGRKNAIRLVKLFRMQDEHVSCIQPSGDSKHKKDWNDLWLDKKLSNFDDYFYYGQLLTAGKADTKGGLMYERNKSPFFVFDFKRQMYIWDLDEEELAAKIAMMKVQLELEEDDELDPEYQKEILKNAKAVSLLSNCVLGLLYTQKNPVTDELFYFFRVQHNDGRNSLNTMTGSQMFKAGDFGKRLLSMASGALIKSNNKAHGWLMNKWMSEIKEVNVVAYAGYAKGHDAWIYPEFAVYKNKLIIKNSEDYIKLNNKLRVKSSYHNVLLNVNFNLEQHTRVDWIHDVYTAWGVKGVIATAYFTMSLFGQQVMALNKSLLFLELVGDAGTGKSTLLEFLWRLFGREDFEGIDPSSSNPAAVARSLNQVANLPVVFMEGDRENHRGGFNWDEAKKLYNGRSMKARGMRTQGNEVYEPPFLGALVIAQNRPVDADRPVLERIAQVYFYKSDTNDETLAAAKRINAFKTEELSGYLIKCLTQSDKMLAMFTQWQSHYEKEFNADPDQKTFRLALNHSQLAAAVKMLELSTQIDGDVVEETIKAIKRMSIEREKAISTDHPDVEQFFEVIEFLENKDIHINHETTGIAINLNELYLAADNQRQSLQIPTVLKKLLKSSPRHIENKVINSKINNKSVRCWLFKNIA